jgi:DNA (cytosine-5)-methyltransferase 1
LNLSCSMAEKHSDSFTFIDLFAGAGGLSEGFIKAGFEPIAHVELEKAACNTLLTRMAYHHLKEINRYEIYVDYLKGKISRDVLHGFLPENLYRSVINLPIGDETNGAIHQIISALKGDRSVDLIIGGPPCQAYSLVGRARSKNKMQGDPRNYLFKQYAGYLEKYQPKMFVFENVLGLKSANNGQYLKEMEKLFEAKGYSIKLFTLEANNFGVLQRRKRIIILGWQKSLDIVIPNLEIIKISGDYQVYDLLSDLPKLLAGEGCEKNGKYRKETTAYLEATAIRNGIDVLTQHVARPHRELDKEIYKVAVEKWNDSKQRLNYNDLVARLQMHNNKTSFLDRFKVVAADLSYAQTVVAHISKDGHYYIHPDQEQNRSITVREAARLQSFPDDYYFEGEKEGANRTAAFKQIGNAVPPLMAKEIAASIECLLRSK